ncbi:alpha-L-rhamnosidase [Microdochium trichocladiopsis]|uniref:alpha-L-rhamnosidase n=1 Tax=Microdochium trichocladiopsis TaxID=1682393 RepID=A0A9P9BL13_9PEZI|nr:alpha-L-rhamnosidase [Microdochium trichocladiopsis]KAH7024462.1 alpha-L-rhamnosidase [Microdochium trichocladiopsis]
MAVSISHISFEHHYPHALGIGETEPRISWRFAGDAVNWTQTSYDMEITRDISHHSHSHPTGEQAQQQQLFSVNGSESVLVPWPTLALSAGERASVRIRARGRQWSDITDVGNNGKKLDSEWSDRYFVEAGLFEKKDWRDAEMIASTSAEDRDVAKRPRLFRKEFSLSSKHGSGSDAGGSHNERYNENWLASGRGQAVMSSPQIARARLYVTAAGLYQAYIDGRSVNGDVVLAPGWQDYGYRRVYDTYDVTEHLTQQGSVDPDLQSDHHHRREDKGRHVLGIVVGEGWYAGRIGWNGGQRNVWGSDLGVLALLVVTMTDGTQRVVKTDESWSYGAGPIIRSEIYDGEEYDAREELEGWMIPGYRAQKGTWGGVKTIDTPFDRLAAPDGPPIMRTGEVELADVLTSPSGKTILDFGQNLVGWLRVKFDGPRGQQIKFRHAEVLENGELAIGPLRNAAQTDTVTLSGNQTLEWEPAFTYHGFRYVEVTGWPDTVPLNKKSIRAIVVHSAMERSGYFECSDPLLNKLHENIIWSMRGNFMSVPTDCPQRDERLGWSGDAHVFARTANYLFDTSGFWRGWMRDVYEEQRARNGSPANVTPSFPWVQNTPITPAVWGDVVVGNPWNTYQSFRDRNILLEQYAGAKAWLDSGIQRQPSTPRNIALWDRDAFQFGDWLDPTAPENDASQAQTDKRFVADAYLVGMTKLVAQMARVLDKRDDEKYHARWADDLQAAFQHAWVHKDGTVYNETQTGIALCLWFDLFRSEREAEAAAARLDNIIAGNEYKVGTGFAGTHILGHALTRYNLTSTFYRMLKQTTVPSWLYQVVMGGTTTWERWDSMLPDGSVNWGGMTSFNHYAFGSVGDWIHRVIGGLAPSEEEGWRKAVVRVEPGGGITHARARYLSPYGWIETEWTADNGKKPKLKVTVPPNAMAEVVMTAHGKERATIGSGQHEFPSAESN